MFIQDSNNSVELLRIKQATFALVFKDKSQDVERISSVVNNLPNCCFDPDRLKKIQILYDDIKEMRCISLEDVYGVFGVDCDENTLLFCNHKRQFIKKYRQHISDVIDQTIEQIKKNINKIDMPKLAYTIFFKAQEFTEEKPRYISNMWCIGNATQANSIMKEAFEHFTTADLDTKNNHEFCAEALVGLLSAYKFSIKDSFRVHYLDSVIDQIFGWYFIESEERFEFLIFMPDVFDEIRDFLLDLIDNCPFVYYLREANGYFEKITNFETALDANNIIYIPENMFEEVKCFRELYKMYDKYYKTHKALKQYGMFDCEVYDITKKVPPSLSKSPCRRKTSAPEIESKLESDCLIFGYENMIYDKLDFVRQVIKPRINKEHNEHLKSA